MNKEELRKLSEKYAKSKGFKLNPNEQIVDVILEGLLKNEKEYGYRYCPCRPVSGDLDEDRDKICPCKWHKDEIKEMGHCHCNLFVKGD
ncbi:MAG: ferredoxin:thioredoxin reductase [Candidatus Aenigmarchaeota archaeon ex4484_56]|nr:MAG: ferredoxin:thioredoxin reductase [Candidatus Aenigmarchaeota archaeon ex4484_56]